MESESSWDRITDITEFLKVVDTLIPQYNEYMIAVDKLYSISGEHLVYDSGDTATIKPYAKNSYKIQLSKYHFIVVSLNSLNPRVVGFIMISILYHYNLIFKIILFRLIQEG